MKSRPKIVVDEQSGELISEYMININLYKINIEQFRYIISIDSGAFKAHLKTIIIGDKESLEEIINNPALLSGKIVIKDSLTPFTNQINSELRVDELSNIILKSNGRPIYRGYFYSQNINERDEIINYNNFSDLQKK